MNPKEAINSGQLDVALEELEADVRKNPADLELRIYLFQLLSVLGQWERVINQLNFIAEMKVHKVMAEIFIPLVQCELLRSSIFAGKEKPSIFGEPQAWAELMIKALQVEVSGDLQMAAQIRSEALEKAPETAGKIDGESFDWICDADSRLGPVLEACINKKYYWIPWDAIKSIVFHPPSDLRDLVWAPVEFVWSNQDKAKGHVFVRYPGTDKADNYQLKLSRLTQWEEKHENQFHGLGQKIFTTGQKDYSLLDIRSLELAS
jgi:type VI secretion system protein ImpE